MPSKDLQCLWLKRNENGSFFLSAGYTVYCENAARTFLFFLVRSFRIQQRACGTATSVHSQQVDYECHCCPITVNNMSSRSPLQLPIKTTTESAASQMESSKIRGSFYLCCRFASSKFKEQKDSIHVCTSTLRMQCHAWKHQKELV